MYLIHMSNAKKLGLLIGDLIVLYAALAATVFVRYGGQFFEGNLRSHLLPFSLVFLGWIFIFYLNDFYAPRVLRTKEVILRKLLISTLISFGFSIMVFYLFGNFFRLTPKTNLVIFALVFLALEYLWRTSLFQKVASEKTRVVVLGDSPLLRQTVDYLRENSQLGYEVYSSHLGSGFDYAEISRLITEEEIRLVVVHPQLVKNPKTLALIYKLLPLEVNVVNFWDFYESVFEKVPLDELSEEWFVENMYGHRPLYDNTKRIVEIVLGVLFSLILLPLSAVIALAIRLTSRGPAIYRQKRVGKNGTVFVLYKFRTMKNNSTGALWTTENDGRLTLVGRLLRYTHLDEIPQLINIIRGDISITGPRPERVELVSQYEQLPYYDVRHIIKPGLSGWAQIRFRPSASLEEAHEKLCYDIYYIKNRSLLLDLIITVRTIRYLFSSKFHG
jgi:exopolysaccharide biosynthesis polyprenyl glycosylphosphotransferase